MPYFENYNYQELREKFVRNRFAEKQIYANPDIEDFLQEQRLADKPFDEWIGVSEEPVEFWLRLAERIEKRNDAATILRQHTTPFLGLSTVTEALNEVGAEIILPLLDFLSSDIEFYITMPTLWIAQEPSIVLVREISAGVQALEIYCLDDAPELSNKIGGHTVLELLYEEWENKSPRWKEVRRFLCDLLAEDIVDIRTQAEMEFDNAIAVSEDGTKIVELPQILTVVLWNLKPITLRHYCGEDLKFFQKNKILRSRKMIRESGQNHFFDYRDLDLQVYLETGGGASFITHQELCPPNLPEPSK